MTILFVCSGNTCRSPLAVAAWRALQAEESALGETEIASAGIAAKSGNASRHAQKIARDWKQDLSAHRARLLRQPTARQSDLIVTMTHFQAQQVRAQFGLPSHRVRVLSEFAQFNRETESDNRVLESALQSEKTTAPHDDEQRFLALLGMDASSQNEAGIAPDDIADPFGGSLEVYETCAARIKNCVKGLRHALRNGAISL